MEKKRGKRFLALVYCSTFFVALCSIAYELMFSQLLTILFGGTVKRYSITIGLFLFSLGIGSFLYTKIKTKPEKFFVIIETAITLIGVCGVFAIIKGTSLYILTLNQYFSVDVIIFLSYIPIIAVGVISGMEIPLLAQLAEKYDGSKKHKFAEVLGVDYFGSLVGTVLFALVLYPILGIVVTAILISFINILLAAFFVFLFNKKNRLFFVVVGIIIICYLIIIPQMNEIQTELIKEFRGNRIFQQQYHNGEKYFDYEVKEFMSTKYQDVIFVEMALNKSYFSSDILNYSCLYLDNDMQVCENFAQAYHGGMVDVPMQYFEPKKMLNVLMVGGGDWIGVNSLLQFDNVNHIDLVDIDKDFSDLAKTNPLLKKFHKGAYKSDKLNVYYEDGFSYLLTNEKKYDLIILDLPGVSHDKLSHLYSVEFFSNIKKSMVEDAVVVSWIYEDMFYHNHVQALNNVLKESGFNIKKEYYSYAINYGKFHPTEKFMILADKKLQLHNISSTYLNATKKIYEEHDGGWKNITSNNDRVHSIFQPNYNIVIKDVLF